MAAPRPVCITFAGPAGCGKSPVAHYVSWHLGLGVYSNDVVRREVAETTLKAEFDPPEYFVRRDAYIKAILGLGRSFILDVSVDRVWQQYRQQLTAAGFDWFIIGFDLSVELLQATSLAKRYSSDRLDPGTVERWHREHQAFSDEFSADVGLVITDTNFANRLELSLAAVRGHLV